MQEQYVKIYFIPITEDKQLEIKVWKMLSFTIRSKIIEKIKINLIKCTRPVH